MALYLPNWNLKDLQLHKDGANGWESYYFSAVYEIDEEDGVYEMTIPRIECPVHFGMPDHTVSMHYYNVEESIDFGLGDLDIVGGWTKKKIKDKTVEMTLEEVCKALGKEIKIIKG